MTPQLVWFRNDLRLADHPALIAAAARGPVAALYVLDDETPGAFGSGWAMGAAQRWWLHHSLASLARDIAARGGRLILRRGRAGPIVQGLAMDLGAQVHTLVHHEPWAHTQGDEAGTVTRHLGVTLATPDSVRSGTGGRYRIFTPWWKKLLEQMPPPRPLAVPELRWADVGHVASDDLEAWGLLPASPDWAGGFRDWQPGEAGAAARLADFAKRAARYDDTRNLPALEGTSRLSPHLALAEVSPNTAWHVIADAVGEAVAEPYLRELGWRDFGANIIDQFPDHGDAPGRDVFNRFPFRDDPAGWRAWQRGQTGYPIVDAGMRQMWATGWMHNRVRMITASFLVKHQLIDWRAGERFFWDCLVDADYGSNSLGWQWVMGSGVDSSPFNRVFAPVGQSEKFGAADYIRRWVPELAGLPDAMIHAPWQAGVGLIRAGVKLGRDYPHPVVGHEEGRARALAAWARVKG
ncbi:cryptochrome/photolyase family protein [Sandarakinorhabdus sp.]|uniref:cryptochrome/photolyase family protein n=1 Tax=Sandarakinorhabdus sp. TaxID=1916663 RepID=UPI003F725F59